jgi:4-hydroxybenzoate polyprenyltransferase
MGFYAAYLAVWAVIGHRLGLGPAFFVGIAIAGGLAGWHFTLIRDRSRDGCFRAFRLNHWVGFAVFAGVVVDAALRTSS